MILGGMGPRMIGEREHRLSKIEQVTVVKGFGARMLGSSPLGDELKAAQAAFETEVAAEQAAPAPVHPDNPDQKFYSLTDIKTVLAEEPGRVGELFTSEQARPDGMRKTALRVLIAAEKAKDHGPDVALLSALEESLTALEA